MQAGRGERGTFDEQTALAGAPGWIALPVGRAESGPTILGLHVVSIVGFSVSTVLAMWLVLGVIRSGRI